MQYKRLRSALYKLGFWVYPKEFCCRGEKRPYVDVAAYRRGEYWAFEYKSRNDSLKSAVEQLRGYSHWFDRVVLVTGRKHLSSRGIYFQELVRLGAGIWLFDGDELRVIVKPVLQATYPYNRRVVRATFNAVRSKRRVSILGKVTLPRLKPRRSLGFGKLKEVLEGV